MPTFQRFDPTDCRFPPPRVPLLPVLRRRDLVFGATPNARALRGAGVRHFARGRYALHAAYQAAGVGAEGALLAPSYHCRTMLDPALALGGAVGFYPVDANLVPDLPAIGAMLAQARPRFKALVVTHYFGFRQPAETIAALAELCRAHGTCLVEDCSHGWRIALEEGPRCASRMGRMVVASPYKFFPCPDGGTLWATSTQLDSIATSAAAPVKELKALVEAVARGRSAGALGAAALAGPADARGRDQAETGELVSIHYQRAQEHQRGLALSRWIVRHGHEDFAAAQRRANYLRWLATVAGLPAARALFAELPYDCAPYMFPLLIDAPDPHFFRLKQLGMPLWRWDDMAVSGCSVAARMRLHLVHLPCHQSLSDAQMDWMTSSLARVVAS